jgi:hypothetical protein
VDINGRRWIVQNGGKARRRVGGPSAEDADRSVPETMKHAFMDAAAKRLICWRCMCQPIHHAFELLRLRMYVWPSIRAVEPWQCIIRAQKTRGTRPALTIICIRSASDLLDLCSRQASLRTYVMMARTGMIEKERAVASPPSWT